MAGFFDNELIKKIIDYVLIISLLIITGYYIYKTIMDRRETNQVAGPPPYNDTPTSSQRAQLNQVESKGVGSGISNTGFDSSVDNALRHYCIKSACNAAYTGGYMNLNMIKYLLQRGCRFLDFEVYMKDNIPIVAYSTNKQSLETFTSDGPAVSLSGVLKTIMSNAFSDTSPNPKDPLFIHLRIKTHDVTAYSEIAKLLKSSLQHKIYADSYGNAVPINLDTQLPSLLGKVIVMVDRNSSPGFDKYSNCSYDTHEKYTASGMEEVSNVGDCISLEKSVNMVTNSQSVRVYQQRELTFQPINPPDPGVYLFRIVFPDLGFFENTYNSDTGYLVKNYGTQVVAQAFYVRDSNLKIYEEYFKNNKSAFVRLETFLKQYDD